MKRDAAGRSLDRLVIGSIIVGVAAGLYAGWLAAVGAVAAYVVALFIGTRLWVMLKMQQHAAEVLGKIERGEPLEPAPVVRRVVLPEGTTVQATRDFGPVRAGAPGVITGVADAPSIYPGGPVYVCTFADNLKTTARPNDIEQFDHGYSLEELQAPDFGPILARHKKLK
jgi:hypothetical protein